MTDPQQSTSDSHANSLMSFKGSFSGLLFVDIFTMKDFHHVMLHYKINRYKNKQAHNVTKSVS